MNTKDNNRNEDSDKEEVHYFASCGLGWATASIRDEAIRKLVDHFRMEFKTMVQGTRKRGQIGAYVWTCQVDVPEDTKYGINFYKPEDVPISEGENHFVTYLTAKEMAYYTEEK